ncbi:chemotaxis protein CheB [Massilia sp. RP-1-19]|uniref:protein-glutamate methylesterase n=1 Tax=Massilia polaris TaxID=2728846 RepID=A0A848HKH9_9BURK|nr:chemotaxis protein CheB [Massilia polaris]NML62376.1 chemotaxis protein CheB [Massilia polaris]
MSEPRFSAALAGRDIHAVVIAGSAGGVDALLHLLPRLPAGYALPVISMLHLPEHRESRLAERFAPRLGLPVREAFDKEEVSPGTVYFAGSGYHLSIEKDFRFSLSCEPAVHFARPAIDVLMESAAQAYGPHLAAVLLTGANQDGAEGMRLIKQCGGLTVVQDPAEAQVATMPEQAIKLQAPDLVLTLPEIGKLLLLLEKK